MFKYDYGTELPDVGSSIRRGYDAVAEGSVVLELGCANGLLTRHLKLNKQCEIDIVEIDDTAGVHAKEFANIALLGEIQGNLEEDYWHQSLEENKYDCILLLDVLEHLKNPQKVLEECKKLLKDTGTVCISVPNIGHNSVIINLINNKFEYQELGILDNTHIRFFCQDTLDKLVKDSGYIAVEKDYTQALVGNTFIDNQYNDVDYQVANALKIRNNGEILQFIYKLKKNEVAGQIEGQLQYQEVTNTLYYNTGDGYSEEYKIINRAHQNKGEFIVDFDVSKLEGVQSYRWDPVEISGMVVTIKSIKIQSNGKSSNIEMHDLNAVGTKQVDRDIFLVADPNYEITGNTESIQRIQIVASIHLLNEKDIASIQEVLDTTKNQIVELNQLKTENQEKLNQQAEMIEERNLKVQDQTLKLEQQLLILDQQTLTLEQQTLTLEQQALTMQQQVFTIEEQKSTLEQQSTVLEEQMTSLEKQQDIIDTQKKVIEEKAKVIQDNEVFYSQQREELKSLKEIVENLVASKEDMHQDILHKTHIINISSARNTELIAEVDLLRHHLNEIQTSYNIISNSTLWKITKPLRALLDCLKKFVEKNRYSNLVYKGIKNIKNEGIRSTKNKTVAKIQNRRKIVKDIQDAIHLDDQVKKTQANTVFDKDIKFSIVVPLYNTPLDFLVEMIESVQSQTYANWELCMADGSDSQHTEVARICKKMARADKRIKYKKLKNNDGISENTNAALSMATGDYIGLFDHDDLLHPSVLYYYMTEICANNADFIYCDEMTFQEKIDNIICVNYKPDFAIDYLRANNYICHFTVFKKELLERVGMFRKEFDGSQDYDMILRLTEQAENIVHIPMVLYFWRAHANSVASDISAKMYTIDAAHKALQEHLERNGLKGTVEDTKILSWYKIKYEIEKQDLVSILIPNKDGVDILKQCIDSIINLSTYSNYEIIVVENNSTEAETFEYYKTIENDARIKVVTYQTDGTFNYSKINNYGSQFCNGEYIILLNNDIEVISPNWIEEMLMLNQRHDVGAVGAKLYYPNDKIQHGGVILGIGGVAGHSHKYLERNHLGYMGRLSCVQNYSACTAACLMVKREVYDEIKGFDTEFAVAFNDIDLCMRIREKGHLICWTPFAEMYHHESITRGEEDTPEKQKRFQGEVLRFQSKWNKQLEQGDPFYNPNLSLTFEDFRFK